MFKGESFDGTVFETGMVCLSTVFVPSLFRRLRLPVSVLTFQSEPGLGNLRTSV